MAAPTMPKLIVEQPGLYDGLTDDDYHSDPVPGGSLSSSGARKLLPPSCPALFKYERDHGRPPKREFDFGHAAHQKVLGIGPEIVKVDADNWRTKAAQEKQQEAYAEGKVPLLAREVAQVDEMAAALRAHPIAAALLRPEGGKPEQSAFWVDDETGIWCRARFDWLPNPRAGRLIIGDYKTSVSASLDHIRKAVYSYGYHQQAPFYLDGARALDLADENAAFVFVVQMKTPPYLVTVVELDAEALDAGRELNRRARAIFRDCTATGHWPGFADDVARISLPPWATRNYEESF